MFTSRSRAAAPKKPKTLPGSASQVATTLIAAKATVGVQDVDGRTEVPTGPWASCDKRWRVHVGEGSVVNEDAPV